MLQNPSEVGGTSQNTCVVTLPRGRCACMNIGVYTRVTPAHPWDPASAGHGFPRRPGEQGELPLLTAVPVLAGQLPGSRCASAVPCRSGTDRASARRSPSQRLCQSISGDVHWLLRAFIAPLALSVFSLQGDLCFQRKNGKWGLCWRPAVLVHGLALAGLQAQPGAGQSPAAARAAAVASG